LVRLGWSHGDKEIFSVEEMIELFDPHNLNKSASSYNLDKLYWLNSHYIRNTSSKKLVNLLKDYNLNLDNFDKIEELFNATKHKAKTLIDLSSEIKKVIETPKEYDSKSLKKAFKGNAKDILVKFLSILEQKEPKSKEDYHNIMQEVVESEQIGFGKIGQPLRVALIGNLSGPGLDEVMYIIGKEETIKRVKSSLEYLKED